MKQAAILPGIARPLLLCLGLGMAVAVFGHGIALHGSDGLLGATIDQPVPDEGFSPGLGLFALVAVTVLLVAVGVGVALAAAVVLAISALVGLGVVSVSVLVGLHHRSLARGFRTFVVLSCVLMGVLAGAPSLWLINRTAHWMGSTWALGGGALLGAVVGLLVGLLSVWMVRRLSGVLMRRSDDLGPD